MKPTLRPGMASPSAPRRPKTLAVAAAFAIVCGLAGCAGPLPPDWQMNAHAALDNSVTAYMTGNSRLAESEFARARYEISNTGRVDLLARALLVRCATQVASLELRPCVEFDAVASDAAPQERAYGQFLSGNWSGLDPALLPQQHRWLVTGKVATEPAAVLAGLSATEDPLSRLVACGVLFQSGRLPPAGIELAVASASGQGWRRPLLAWLGAWAQHAKTAGDSALAAKIQRRIDLTAGVGAKK